jgi:hypothetical protein
MTICYEAEREGKMIDKIEFVKAMEEKLKFKFSYRSWRAFFFGTLFGTVFYILHTTAKDEGQCLISGIGFWGLSITLAIAVLTIIYDVLLFLKYLYWDMVPVAIIGNDGFRFPQNRIWAKKAGLKYGKPTREEIIKWDLKNNYQEIPFISKEDELKFNMNNPLMSQEKYLKLRKEYDEMKPK